AILVRLRAPGGGEPGAFGDEIGGDEGGWGSRNNLRTRPQNNSGKFLTIVRTRHAAEREENKQYDA
ncbi:MAG: hypothetical protein WBP40_01205, partial [Candidatus Moraniibacteriota bacterium]